MLQQFVMHMPKITSTHEGTCRYDMSLGLVPATVTCVCTNFDFVAATCPCYMSPLHVPATCPLSVNNT